MAVSSTPQNHFSDEVIWDSLKRAIATSSGFQRWRTEQDFAEQSSASEDSQTEDGLEQLVSRYLRETLATLAY